MTTAYQDRRVLPSNADAPLPGSAASRSSLLWPVLLLIAVALSAIAAATLFCSRPTTAVTRATPLPSADQPDPGGNAIVHDCFAVDDHTCLTANPSLHPALQQLATTGLGASLLQADARAGVAVRLGTPQSGFYASFDPKLRQITLDTSLTGMTARGQAAILAHEFRAVATWSSPAGILPNKGLTCIQEQTSAFATELAVWKELRGEGAPKDALETEEDDLVQRMDSHGLGFWLELALKLRAGCG